MVCRFFLLVQALGGSSGRRAEERFVWYSAAADLLGGKMREAIKVWRYSSGYSNRRRYRRYIRALLVGFLPLLFLLASCSGGGGGGGGGGQDVLSVELAFIPGDGNVTVNLVEKGSLVQLLNISTYQLTAIDLANQTMRIEGSRLAEGAFNGSTLRGLTNDRNYTFTLQVFYFPVGSDQLSSLSLMIDYAGVNARNIKDAGGITVGINTDGDYLADLVDEDDDNDMVADAEDLGEYNGRLCRLFADCDSDTVLDAEDSGEFNGKSCRTKPDCDDDMLMDASDNCVVIANLDQADGDGDGAGDACDLDIDGDGLIEIETAAELDAVRWVLNGSGWRRSAEAPLNQTGCVNSAGSEDDCHGYELIRNISLAAYADGAGWAPLGQDMDSSAPDCQGAGFSGVFEGNGFTVRNMRVNRSEEDCIGLFGHLAAGTVIRNLTLRAEAVIGRHAVGGLVGNGEGATIILSSSVVGEVSGASDTVGGLVGVGSDARIVSSYSVTGNLSSASSYVGGLVGWGEGVEIVSSYSVADKVSGGSGFSDAVGGLVGWGIDAEIASSYAVTGELTGGFYVGGLVGFGADAEIVSSYSVAGDVRGFAFIGGLLGIGGDVNVSYWHIPITVTDNDKGEEKNLAELRLPTNDNAYDAISIYANWTNGANIDNTTGVEDITIYCDEDLSGAIETDEMRDGSGGDNRIWDFGISTEYPAIRCAPLSLAEQRSWWSINRATNRPQLNQDRLNSLTSP